MTEYQEALVAMLMQAGVIRAGMVDPTAVNVSAYEIAVGLLRRDGVIVEMPVAWKTLSKFDTRKRWLEVKEKV